MTGATNLAVLFDFPRVWSLFYNGAMLKVVDVESRKGF